MEPLPPAAPIVVEPSLPAAPVQFVTAKINKDIKKDTSDVLRIYRPGALLLTINVMSKGFPVKYAVMNRNNIILEGTLGYTRNPEKLTRTIQTAANERYRINLESFRGAAVATGQLRLIN